MNYRLYNDTLCLDVWDQDGDSYKLKSDVQKALLKIAEGFIEKNLTENDLSLTVKDVILIGSITNFNWTPYSDFDMHIIVDFAELDMSPEDAKVLVDGLKSSWNKEHAITIKGHPVELYIQDVKEEPSSMSSYSVKNDDWIKRPVKHTPTFDKEFIKRKHAQIKSKLDDMLANPSEESLEAMLERIYDMRQAGLDKKGEFSEENIVFKILRSQGYLDRIKDAARKVYDAERSLDEIEKLDDGLWPKKTDDRIVHNYEDDEYELIPTHDDSANRIWKFHGHKVFGAYRIVPRIAKGMNNDIHVPPLSDQMTNLRHALKHPADTESKRTVIDLVKVSIDRMFQQIDTKSIDILVPLGSKSNLNKVVADEIKRRLPNVQTLNDIQKKKWKDVTLSHVWKHEVDANNGVPKEGPRRAAKALQDKQRLHPDDTFEIKSVERGLRRYFGNFYTDTRTNLRGKTILVIDDTMEEGATFQDVIRVLEKYNPKEIIGYIFLFGRGSKI